MYLSWRHGRTAPWPSCLSRLKNLITKIKKMAPAEMPDVIMTLVSYFCGLPGVPERLVNIGTIGPVSASKSQFADPI